MTDMERLAAPLRAALEAKGYRSLTPVQTAILADEHSTRDLLVSAQTGSGKTVAFGLAIAPTIFDDAAIGAAGAPLALVIAPTRELALQVRDELAWLFSGATIASCVGGMDARTERWALQRGAHVVVGTPGRLRDHVERGSLDLTAIRAVVLDEADEMLDMGFAEDLDFLLGRTPEERRVLMFSATVPEGIAALAARYQKDAARLEVAGERRQHADIDYQAIRVARRDRDAAVFNLLRWHDAQTALVFARTRADVSHLHARMANRGFAVVALSGELSQAERLGTLTALRDGRARVCIATDVAARGIDLPGLDLVIHADLPANAETLLHRSGRTGRAGRKGTSVLIVTQAETGRAGRLFHAAGVVPKWARAPGADAVREREDARLVADAALADATAEEAGLAAELIAAHGAGSVAAAFVRLWRAGRSAPEELAEDLPPPAPAAPPRDRRDFGDSVWFRLPVGHEQRAEARWLLPRICEAGGIARDGIGAIRVSREETFVQIATALADRFHGVEIAPGVTMARMEGPPDTTRPAPRAPRPHPQDRSSRHEHPRQGDRAPRQDHPGDGRTRHDRAGHDKTGHDKTGHDGSERARSTRPPHDARARSGPAGKPAKFARPRGKPGRPPDAPTPHGPGATPGKKPWKRKAGDGKKPWERKGGEGKGGEGGHRGFPPDRTTPRTDPRDTSKRFVPPGKKR